MIATPATGKHPAAWLELDIGPVMDEIPATGPAKLG
jgi:hypothetical protein